MSTVEHQLPSIETFLSDKGDRYLESMARAARRETLKKFGKTILLYTPVYLSNECSNACMYCGFNVNNPIPRKTLTHDEMAAEFQRISRWGVRHILLVTGEAPKTVTMDYMKESVRLAKSFFPSVNLEIYPLPEQGYREMINTGADGLILYQETYHRDTYRELHSGTKANYENRLKAVEDACRAGFRRVGVGALLGLYDPVYEVKALIDHLKSLKKRYWKTFFSVSFPRMRKAEKGISPRYAVSDKLLVKLILLIRMHFDDVGLVISTRERPELRNHLMHLGVTQMSAGSRTEPGGYCSPDNELKQFEIEDDRSPEDLAEYIAQNGYEPVWKDWDRGLL